MSKVKGFTKVLSETAKGKRCPTLRDTLNDSTIKKLEERRAAAAMRELERSMSKEK